MRLTNFFNENLIYFVNGQSKKKVIEEMLKELDKKNNIKMKKVLNKIMEREKLGSTGIGKGIAIPHCKIKDIKKPILSIGISKNGVNFNSTDKKETNLIILVISPIDNPTLHLQLLASAAHFAQISSGVIKDLLKLDSASKAYELMRESELNN